MKLSFLYVYIFCFKTQNYELCGHISLISIFIMNFKLKIYNKFEVGGS